MLIDSMGEAWFDDPSRGRWHILDHYGRPEYPEFVRLSERRFRRAVWRQARAGVVEQYRESVEHNSSHLYVLADGSWIISHADDVNPDVGDETAPLRHLFADHPVGKGLLVAGFVLAAATIVATVTGARGRRLRSG